MIHRRCRTLINGKPAVWGPELWRLFGQHVDHRGYIVTHANYYEPRPYVDQYNRGSAERGFVYTLQTRQVCFARLPPTSPPAVVGGDGEAERQATEEHPN